MEGIIKFQCEHITSDVPFDVNDIENSRVALLNAGLIGRDPNRYGGYSFGNVSERRDNKILITASQTSHIKKLDYTGYVFIEQANLQNNSLISIGCNKPSSETLTHVAVYEQDPQVGAIAHIHCPKMWVRTDLLRTNPDAEFGSKEMVNEVIRLFKETDVKKQQIFAMGGHQDGIIAFGPNIKSAVDILINFCEI